MCGDVIVGDPHVERVDDSERGDRPELAFWCAACAYVEFVTGTGPDAAARATRARLIAATGRGYPSSPALG